CYKKALQLFTQINDEVNMANTNYWLGKTHEAESFKYYDAATQLFYKLQHGEGTALSLVGQGVCLTESENYPEAEKVLETALDIARQIDEPEILDDVLYRLARVYYLEEKFFKGQKLIEEAIDINRQTQDFEDLAYMLFTYGKILFSLEKFTEAFAAFKESEDINRKNGNLRAIPEIMFNLGKTAFMTEDYSSALLYFQAEVSMRGDYDTSDKISAYHNLAFICEKLGYLDDSVEYDLKLIEVCENKEFYLNDLCETYFHLATVLFQKQDFSQAEYACQKVLEIVDVIKSSNESYDDESAKNDVTELLKKIKQRKPSEDEPLPKLETDDVFTEDFVAETIKLIIAEKLGVEEGEVVDTAGLTDDLGCDELDSVELLMLLEKEFGITVKDEDWEAVKTVDDVIKLILSLFKI
nr:acyl carrier protein [Bacteroidales bacterium]